MQLFCFVVLQKPCYKVYFRFQLYTFHSFVWTSVSVVWIVGSSGGSCEKCKRRSVMWLNLVCQCAVRPPRSWVPICRCAVLFTVTQLCTLPNPLGPNIPQWIKACCASTKIPWFQDTPPRCNLIKYSSLRHHNHHHVCYSSPPSLL